MLADTKINYKILTKINLLIRTYFPWRKRQYQENRKCLFTDWISTEMACNPFFFSKFSNICSSAKIWRFFKKHSWKLLGFEYSRLTSLIMLLIKYMSVEVFYYDMEIFITLHIPTECLLNDWKKCVSLSKISKAKKTVALNQRLLIHNFTKSSTTPTKVSPWYFISFTTNNKLNSEC